MVVVKMIGCRWVCALLLLVAACGRAGRPDYVDAAAIAEALQTAGIGCAYSPMPSAEPFLAESSGRCDGRDFSVLIYVFATSAERMDRELAARTYWCGRGVGHGSYVSAHRWLVTLDAPQTDDPSAVYMRDLAAATGGERVPQRCD